MKPLDAGFVKANFDRAIFEELRATGIGVAVQNEHGEVDVTLAEQIPIPDSVLLLKLWLLGVRFCLFENLVL